MAIAGTGRQNDVLWEVTDERRDMLAGGREPVFNEIRPNAFVLVDGRLQRIPIEGRKNLEGVSPIWIDLLGASKAERNYVGSNFGLKLPDPDALTDLETSARHQFPVLTFMALKRLETRPPKMKKTR